MYSHTITKTGAIWYYKLINGKRKRVKESDVPESYIVSVAPRKKSPKRKLKKASPKGKVKSVSPKRVSPKMKTQLITREKNSILVEPKGMPPGTKVHIDISSYIFVSPKGFKVTLNVPTPKESYEHTLYIPTDTSINWGGYGDMTVKDTDEFAILLNYIISFAKAYKT